VNALDRRDDGVRPVGVSGSFALGLCLGIDLRIHLGVGLGSTLGRTFGSPSHRGHRDQLLDPVVGAMPGVAALVGCGV